MAETVTLYPAENMALTVARSRLDRGEDIEPNTAAMLVMALDRVTGRKDWTGAEFDRLLAERDQNDG